MTISSFISRSSILKNVLLQLNFIKCLMIMGVAISLTMTSCKSDDPPTPAESPNKISIVSGDFQVGLQNEELPEIVEVKLEDENGNALANKTLQAEVFKGDGRVIDDEVSTNAAGIATFKWELGLEPFNNLRVSEAEFPSNQVELSARSKYNYILPENANDGWQALHIDSVSVDREKILEAVDEVRWGTFPEVHSILLALDGKLILDTYFPGTNSFGDFIEFDRSTPHELHSANKTFRSALIGIAIDKGHINDENVALSTLFPELTYLTQGGKENMLLEHILTMSTGLEWDETVPAPNSLSEMYTLPYDQWYDYILSKPLVSSPGSEFVYNTGASLILNRILLENVNSAIVPFMESNYSELVESEELFGAGYPFGSSEITPREMLKLGQVYANDGKWKDTQVISKEWVDKSVEPAQTVSSNYTYGYQWWIRDIETDQQTHHSYSAIGFGGQHIIVIKDLGLVAVFTGGNFQTPDRVVEIMRDHVLPAFE